MASEKVLDQRVKMLENPQTHLGNRKRGLDLIRAWGQSEDLAYLPVFHQTYMVSSVYLMLFLISDFSILMFVMAFLCVR